MFNGPVRNYRNGLIPYPAGNRVLEYEQDSLFDPTTDQTVDYSVYYKDSQNAAWTTPPTRI